MKLVHLAMTGAVETMNAQAVCAQNLASSSIPGFKAALVAERAMPTYGDGFPSRVYVGAETTGYDFKPGPIESTGEPLDVAVNGPGWMAVQDSEGHEAYTRRGDLRVDNGLLVNGAGNLIIGAGGAISVPPAQSIRIMEDGSINVIPLGVNSATVTVGNIKLVNPAVQNLTKKENGLFVSKTGEVIDADQSVKLKAEVLEGSNVSAVGEMIEMISLARQHELSIKMMSSAEETDQASAQLLQVN